VFEFSSNGIGVSKTFFLSRPARAESTLIKGGCEGFSDVAQAVGRRGMLTGSPPIENRSERESVIK
jgi:hypothetical protein